MTRKCIMCKGKNYKSTCSFFSAPKDPRTRNLWQEAINIKDYVVTDETFVCSKHFTKDDIITHWISGVPPQVITIKYKKCRLRRGAVPIPNIRTNHTCIDVALEYKNSEIILNSKKYFIESKKKEIDNNKLEKTEQYLNENLNYYLEDEIYEYIPEEFQELGALEKPKVLKEKCKRNTLVNSSISKEQIVYSTTEKKEILYINYRNSNNNTQNFFTYFPKRNYFKINDKSLNKSSLAVTNKKNEQIKNSSINWHVNTIKKKLQINNTNEQLKKSICNYAVDPNQEIFCNNILMLFEDFLESYNEVSLPRSWFASMVTKEHDITIVYSCMNISNSGMPYVEKKVFLNNEMILRCGILNKEINKISFLKSGKSLNVYTLSDIEDFIEEFDQTSICKGVVNNEYINKINSTLISCDGEAKRHNECLMILSKGQSMCFQCASLINHFKLKKY